MGKERQARTARRKRWEKGAYVCGWGKESEALGRKHEDQPERRAVNDDFRNAGKGG